MVCGVIGHNYFDRTLMWMQPAPAHHLGPMRMRLRKPAWTNPLCRVASHALFGPWLRSGSPPGAEQPQVTRNAPLRKRKLPETPKIPGWSRGWNSLPSRQSRMAHTHPAITPARQIQLADHGHKPTGSNRTLSPMAATQAGIKSSALAEGGQCDREQVIARSPHNRTTPIRSIKSISIPRPNV